MTVTHPEHEKDYIAGREDVRRDVDSMGIDAASQKWREENQENPKSLGAYYYAKGGLDYIVEVR